MNSQQKIVTILGAGVWGSALATLLERGDRACVRFWSRRGSVPLSDAIARADVILSAVSMLGVRPTVEAVKAVNLPKNVIFVSATKGLDPSTRQTPSRIWQGAFPQNPVVVLSGPNLSKEIQQSLPAATVAASADLTAARAIQDIFSSDTFRVYVNSDPLGTELGGTLKNVMAIAAGVCDGLHLGTNAKAALLTRALPEMMRVGTRLGASATTFYGLSGIGDLLATCNSPLSRNYQVGYGLARGNNLEAILANLEGTAEGINTTQVLVQLAKEQKIDVPIAQQVYQLLEGRVTPQEAVHALMERELKSE